MRILFTLLFLFFSGTFVHAQQEGARIKGNVADVSGQFKLSRATALVMHARDSIMVGYARTDQQGNFELSKTLSPGDYILLVTYPAYADFVQTFSLDSISTSYDFGVLDMTLKSKLLEEIIIGGARAINIKGDTTEFDASAYVIQPNDRVEDLIKQFPGIQVDASGKITAQGETVGKVLVDGEEFFGDDPTLVTRNLRSDMVSKVQLYDKKSDQAEFTGIDDGEKTKTLNIILKEDKKKGYFGKADVGIGNNDMYTAQAMFNRFSGKQKFSAYGTFGNTGKVGLNFGDAQRFGGGMGDMQFGDDGSISISISGSMDGLDSFDGRYDGQGIPNARSGGAHYSNKWAEDKHSLNANYKIGEMELKGNTNTISQNILPTGTIHSTSNQHFDNYSYRQNAGAIYERQFDPSSSLKVNVGGTLRSGTVNRQYASASTDESGNPLNEGIRNVQNKTDGQEFNVSVLWRKRLKKTGRTLSWDLSQAYTDSRGTGFLYSENDFYKPGDGGLDSTSVIDQYKVENTVSSVLTSNITYTEPLTDKLSLVFNYRASLNNSNSLRQSFNADHMAGREYNQLDSLYSNDFRLNQLTNQLGANFNFKQDKHTVNFGTRISSVGFDQVDRYSGQEFNRNFVNWNPQASWQYRIAQQTSLRLTYNGNSNQPRIDQIQPVRVNTDPLNITLGNPDLKPTFTSRFNANFNTYKMLRGESMYASVSYSTTNNPIVMNTVTDAVGKSTYQSINLHGNTNSNYYAYGSYDRSIIKNRLSAGWNLNVSGSESHSMINSELNKMTSSSYSLRASSYWRIERKYDLSVNFGPSYTITEASLQPDRNNNGWGTSGGFNMNLYLPWKIRFGSNGEYSYSPATKSFDESFERFIINAHVQKGFLKDGALILKLSVDDLLGQNTGFSRSASSNFITQTRYTTVTRYVMFSLIWDFNKMGGSN